MKENLNNWEWWKTVAIATIFLNILSTYIKAPVEARVRSGLSLWRFYVRDRAKLDDAFVTILRGDPAAIILYSQNASHLRMHGVVCVVVSSVVIFSKPIDGSIPGWMLLAISIVLFLLGFLFNKIADGMAQHVKVASMENPPEK